MSFGLDIEISHDDGYTTWIEVVDGHTYNLTPMWRLAGVVESRSSELDGRTTAEIAPIALAGLVKAWTDPGAFRALDPPNGWGDFDGFLEIYTRFVRLCHEHPKGVIRWNG